MRKTIVLLSLVAGLTALSTSAFAVAFSAPGTSNIFAAGGSLLTAGDGSGTAPTFISFGAGGGTLTFSGVTGTVNCGPFCAAEPSGPTSNGPDGAAYRSE